MDGQLSFASLDFAGKKKRTKRDVFLAEMAAVVPWSVLESLIEPHYPKVGPQGGRRPFPIAVMLRIYCLQQWYQLSDPGAEEALYDIQSMRAFCNLELGRDPIPDETTRGLLLAGRGGGKAPALGPLAFGKPDLNMLALRTIEREQLVARAVSLYPK
jgi:hypothetical protein